MEKVMSKKLKDPGKITQAFLTKFCRTFSKELEDSCLDSNQDTLEISFDAIVRCAQNIGKCTCCDCYTDKFVVGFDCILCLDCLEEAKKEVKT